MIYSLFLPFLRVANIEKIDNQKFPNTLQRCKKRLLYA